MKKYILMFGLTLLIGLFISNSVVAQEWQRVGTNVTLLNIGDRVGIGTASPSVKLHVNGGSAISDIWATKSVAAANQQIGRFRIVNDATGTLFNISLRTNAAGQHEMLQSIQPATGQPFLEYAFVNIPEKRYEMRSGIDVALFNNTGPVGIGVSIADIGKLAGAKLGVNGKIVATEVEVKLFGSWPDFVFNEKYDLRSLNEVENFITANRHLPDVPTEAQVTENGINLGEMTGVLLQKIEELTLYIIDLNKRIEELEK